MTLEGNGIQGGLTTSRPLGQSFSPTTTIMGEKKVREKLEWEKKSSSTS